MNLVFPIFMVLVAMVGGGFLLKISDENSGDASIGYALLAVLWALSCLGLAAVGFVK